MCAWGCSSSCTPKGPTLLSSGAPVGLFVRGIEAGIEALDSDGVFGVGVVDQLDLDDSVAGRLILKFGLRSAPASCYHPGSCSAWGGQ